MAKKKESNKLSTFDREVEDDLQQEQISNLWNRFGNIVIGIVLAAVLFTAGSEFFEYYTHKQKSDAGKAYFAQIQKTKKLPKDQVLEDWKNYVDTGLPDGYELLGKLQLAQEYMASKELQNAYTVYYQISQNADHPVYFRNFSLMNATLIALQTDHVKGIKDVEKQLSLVSNQNSTWSGMAKELLAWISLKNGDIQQAKSFLTQVSVDPEASQLMKKRAEKLLATLEE